jgi:aldehyde dehydrogenase (NAD+)
MDYPALVQRQRDFFQSGATRSLAFRRAQLEKLLAALNEFEAPLLAALKADLGKSEFQGYASEFGLVQSEIRHSLKNLARWTRPQRKPTPWFVQPARGWVQPEPYGVALILGPWNYPAQLLLAPLVAAIAAGNCVMLKPSELAPATATVVMELVHKTFAPEFVGTATGGPEVATELLQIRFDKIFFTGSTRVGRVVMSAAAQHLTPITLELGGKCPAMVCADAPIELAARRIAWGKFLNAGQTCVAPDFVLVQRSIRAPFVAAMQAALQKFYGADPGTSPDYGRIINQKHFDRLVAYLADGNVWHGGTQERATRFIAPTILGEVNWNSPVMQEEIFGPILPVLEFERLDEVVAQLQSRPTPLALYLFTQDRATETRLLTEVRSGGVCLNDTISHMVGTGLPFGGLGESGLGAYHGQAGFAAFSHQRAVLRRGTWWDPPFRYPPQQLSLTALKKAFRFLLGD